VLGTTRRGSVATNGEEGDLDGLRAAINADALVIAFGSPPSTLEPESGEGFFASDVFVRDARPAADLALTLDDSPAPQRRCAATSRTRRRSRNGGPAAATGETLLAELPADASITSPPGATARQGKTSSQLTCNLGALVIVRIHDGEHLSSGRRATARSRSRHVSGPSSRTRTSRATGPPNPPPSSVNAEVVVRAPPLRRRPHAQLAQPAWRLQSVVRVRA
jgi:hypothetical protein